MGKWAKGAGAQPSTGRRPVGGWVAVPGAEGIVHLSTPDQCKYFPEVRGWGVQGGGESADPPKGLCPSAPRWGAFTRPSPGGIPWMQSHPGGSGGSGSRTRSRAFHPASRPCGVPYGHPASLGRTGAAGSLRRPLTGLRSARGGEQARPRWGVPRRSQEPVRAVLSRAVAQRRIYAHFAVTGPKGRAATRLVSTRRA